MNRLDELIKKFCPNGVEYKTLGELCSISAGGDVPKDNFTKESNDKYKVPIYSNGIGDNALYGYTNIAKIKERCVTIAARGTIGYCALRTVPFYPIIRLICAIPKDNLSADYLKYCIETISFQVPRTGIPQLTVPMLSIYKIPVPPLPVQAEIVRILDSFTELTDKLTTELAARRKQYEYYSGMLLSFDDNMIYSKLRQLVDFKNGKGHENDITVDGKYIVVNSKFISTNGKVKKHCSKQLCPLFVDDILMVMSDLPNGRALAKCMLVNQDDLYTLNQRIGAFHIKTKKISTKFLYYVLNRNPQLLKYNNGVDQTNLKKDDILNIDIPVPPLKEQERIVSILDRFDKLCNDLTEGLPAEITARQKQYEYYRDKLLNFKEKTKE